MVAETRTQLERWNDSTTLVHVSHSEIVMLETIRFHHADTLKMVTRKIVVRETAADTTAAASSSLHSDFVADTTQTTSQSPLMVQSKKKGRAWLCPLIIFGGWIFLTLLATFLLCCKKK